MKKLLRNIFNLISIGTPYYIIINYIKNYFPNYRKKKECLKIDEKIYLNFKSEDISKKWFTNNLYFLKKNLSSHVFENLLEIGSYEGRSAIFFADLFKDSKISCVDTWVGSDEHKHINFNSIENNFDHNIKPLKDKGKLIKFKMTSDEFFKINNNKFDFIYIDGDHSNDQVLKDLKNSWSFLNNNGFLLIDDYMWWYYKDLRNNPASSVNSFIKDNINQINKLIVWHQVLIQKK
tara:strand:- start:491 stop:1192 length:702 start_codon:yes stop_codon:yes gene_type:complete